MLARSPLCQTWHDDTPNLSRLVENGVTLAIIDRAYGRWNGRIEQTVIKHHAKSTRSTVGGLSGYTSREACKIAVEDRIHAVRNPDPAFARSDASALGREARAADGGEHEWANRPDQLSTYDVLGARWL
jgi:hypothetical protein